MRSIPQQKNFNLSKNEGSMTMMTQKLWNGTTIPALGLGCWAIGGIWSSGNTPLGWGRIDDAESIRAIHCAVAGGIRFFDTAQVYGTGHSEEILGQALAGQSDVIVATKIGYAIDSASKQLIGPDYASSSIQHSIEVSLKRLRRERIDLVHLHLNALAISDAEGVFDTLEELVIAGKLGAYGWSTDFPDRAAVFAQRSHFVSVQHAMNVFFRADALIPVIEANGLLSINRSPLAMGLLGGKYSADTKVIGDDVRGQNADWISYFKDGKIAPEFAQMLGAVRDLLQSDGRTLAQGAISWLWSRSNRTLPIPGFRTVRQVEDIVGALAKGPLPETMMSEIERLIVRPPEGPPRER
jgi:aryl-alcohol dehydrogenase-like predicted oxidoreductase